MNEKERNEVYDAIAQFVEAKILSLYCGSAGNHPRGICRNESNLCYVAPETGVDIARQRLKKAITLINKKGEKK